MLGKLRVCRHDFPGNGGVNLGGGFGGLDNGAISRPRDARADRGQLDIDEVAELVGGDSGDADGDGAVAVIGDPLVRLGVLERLWQLWQLHGASWRA
jgi:hypothetical protein